MAAAGRPDSLSLPVIDAEESASLTFSDTRITALGTPSPASANALDVSSPQPHRQTPSTAIIVGASVGGGVVFLLLLTFATFLFLRRRRRQRTLYPLGPLQAALPLSKEAFTSPKYSNHGLSFSQSSDSVDALPATPRVSVRLGPRTAGGPQSPPASPSPRRTRKASGLGPGAGAENSKAEVV
ncbi:hypothetical protein MIND_00375400 [Mycena indigotica]|uniref:Uncharacterized protein n=1 Tax=Mycena indigotica TaxID=2126181 RepID=A0A8H6T121_9AGAR|nr:uncharacterized protein MIND_00375400 [Mycena indigotica]KAF7310025.1 hypothetical protein MIND_00375400 [Mycena indigotica]